MDTNITAYTSCRKGGCSENGRQMPPRYISWAISTIGKRQNVTAPSASKEQATGSCAYPKRQFLMATSTRCTCIGTAETENAFQLGCAAWFKTNKRTSSRPKFGNPNMLTSGRRRSSSPPLRPCSSTSAILVWGKMPKRLGRTPNLKNLFCRALSKTDTTAYR